MWLLAVQGDFGAVVVASESEVDALAHQDGAADGLRAGVLVRVQGLDGVRCRGIEAAELNGGVLKTEALRVQVGEDDCLRAILRDVLDIRRTCGISRLVRRIGFGKAVELAVRDRCANAFCKGQ